MKRLYLSSPIFASWFLLFVICFLSPPSASAATTLQKVRLNNLGLVGYWSMDGADVTDAVYDRSGQGNNGYFVGGATSSAKTIGKIGQALTFNSTTYVQVPGSSSLNIRGSITISSWIMRKTNLTNDESQYIVSNIGEPSGFLYTFAQYHLNGFGDGLQFLAGTGRDGGTHAVTGLSYTINTWHHCVAVLDTVTHVLTMYSDGVQVFQGAENVNSWVDGSGNVYVASGMNAVVDDTRVYNRALSASEVKALYQSGSAKFNSSNNNKQTNGLYDLWSFDGADVTDAIYDRGPSGFNLGFFGGATSTAKVIGKIGQALNFNGTSNYVSGGFVDLGHIRTISLWFNTNATINSTSTFYPLIQLYTNSPDHFWYVSVGPGTVLCTNEYITIADSIAGSSLRTCVADGGSISPGWHSMILNWNGSAWDVYIDGVQKTTVLYGGADVPTGNILNIGAVGDDGNPPGSFFAGKIDDVRLYNLSRTPAEVKQLYDMGNTPVHANTSQNTKSTNGLVGLWSFDGADISGTTAYDRSGSGNNGTITGGVSKTIGKIGQALSFNASNEHIIVNNSVLGTGSFTYTAWFKTTGVSQGLAGVYTGDVGSSELYQDVNGKMRIYAYGATFADRESANAVNDNAWHFAVGTYDGVNLNMYIDGNLSNGTLGGTGIPASTNATNLFIIGDENPPVLAQYIGSLDDVRIYNRALSAAEVKQLYLAGK